MPRGRTVRSGSLVPGSSAKLWPSLPAGSTLLKPSSKLSLRQLWLCEAIRLREEHAGPLEDAEANREARAGGGDLSLRIARRAQALARRDGQAQALQHWLQGARLALIVLLVVALFSGFGLAFAALGEGQRPVNVFWALGGLLGVNGLLLLGWLLGLLLLRNGGAPLGRIWLWLSEKLARDAKAVHLAPALLSLLGRRRLERWGLGLLVHGFWALTMLAALLALLLLLATRRYGFLWESTILGGDTFVALTHALGWLPALFGFPQPDATLVLASGDASMTAEAARQRWAGWLVGVVLVYGLLPRLLLLGFCLWRWRRGSAALALPLDAAGYLLLRPRLMPDHERLGIRDGDPGSVYQPAAGQGSAASQGALLVGVELAARQGWPPPLPAGVADGGVVDSREQRQQLLEQLSRFPVQRLAIACDPRRSPDRGSLALLGELSRCAAATRVWLLPAPAGEALDAVRLELWREALTRAGLAWTEDAPLTWLETGDE